MSSEPPRDCELCPRLRAFLLAQRSEHPEWHNAPVPTFAPDERDVRLLVIGLAPGLRGANRTGRAFTGDGAGNPLYATLLRYGFATGRFDARPDDGLALRDCAITNAVRCVPPQNKPTASEVNTCRSFLRPTVERFPNLTDVLCLGRISHDSTVRAFGARIAANPFGHGATHTIDGLRLHDTYHCSRYNMNTGVLTIEMFDAVITGIRQAITDDPR